jgi:hypothetical protein
VNRVHKALESANLKLASVATDSMGVSGRAILAALLAGERDPAILADLAKGPLRKKRPQLEQALRGQLQPHQSFVLTELLAQIDGLDETIARFTAQIQATGAQDAADAKVVALLDSIPGLSEASAQVVVAEIGADMSRFPSAAALAAWAGLAPGHNASAGRQRRTAAQWSHSQGQYVAAHSARPIRAGRRPHQTYGSGRPLSTHRCSAWAQEGHRGPRPCAARHHLPRHRAPPTLPRTRRRLLPASGSTGAGQAIGPAPRTPGLRSTVAVSARLSAPKGNSSARRRLLTISFSGESPEIFLLEESEQLSR